MYIVAQDGSGDFSTIQAAIDYMPASNPDKRLLVKNGVYKERVVINKDGIHLIGEDIEHTVITFSACARDLDENGQEKGTFLSFTMITAGNNIVIENITIRNDAGDGRIAGQAVAVYAAGDRGIWRNCRLIACQDTLFCGPLMPKVEKEIAPRLGIAECVESVGDCPLTSGRHYFDHCFIRGDVDFIFGPYRCWFEHCTLYMNARGGFYTSANTPYDQPYGFVFNHCFLTGECEKGKAYLGRPWRKYARTAFLNCEMDECVSPQGFQDWDEERKVTERYAEFQSKVNDSLLSLRHPGQKMMKPEEANVYTITNVIGGMDRWRPDLT